LWADDVRAVEGATALLMMLVNLFLLLVGIRAVLLNVVNTTGEYARLRTAHVAALAAARPSLDTQAFIGSFSGEHQFRVNITALRLQAFITSRLVRPKPDHRRH
jgi:hypothetical protein